MNSLPSTTPFKTTPGALTDAGTDADTDAGTDAETLSEPAERIAQAGAAPDDESVAIGGASPKTRVGTDAAPMRRMVERLGSAVDATVQRQDRLMKNARAEVRAHPLSALAIAFMTGLLFERVRHPRASRGGE